MKKFLSFAIGFMVFQAFAADSLPEISEPALRAELIEMGELDQKPRLANDLSAMQKADDMNRMRLKEIVAKYGWPSISMVGRDGARAAFLIIQHSNPEPEFQEYALRLMKPLVEKMEVSGVEYAYLYDRTHRPQLYGTQGNCTGPGIWAAREMLDPEHVDERRVAVGIKPALLSEYAAFVGKMSCTKKVAQ